jgi:hypothetical protein
LDLKSGRGIKVLTVVSDNGPKRARFVGYEVSVRSILSVGRGAYRLRNLINNAYNVIFVNPRLPLLFLKRLNVSRLIILRLWSIRAAKDDLILIERVCGVINSHGVTRTQYVEFIS